jgi:hypothetical protein
MEKIRASSMAQQQAYLDAPRRWTHMLQEQGKSIGQTKRR